MSVNLAWLSGFNGGSTQTFTVICKPSDSEYEIVFKGIPDPGYQQMGHLFVGNLSSEYRITVQTKNLYTAGLNTNKSQTETFVTKGKTQRIPEIFIYQIKQ